MAALYRWVEPPDLGSVEGYMVAEHATSADCWTVLHGALMLFIALAFGVCGLGVGVRGWRFRA
eukprot:3935066-Rhodomonas_salina.1